jgi:hypothetical protein
MRTKVRLYLSVFLLTMLLLVLLTGGDCDGTSTDPEDDGRFDA